MNQLQKALLTVSLALGTLPDAWAAQNASAIPVFVRDVREVSFADEVETLGTLQANENVDLRSPVTERVTKIHFEDNQRVSRGDLLVEMDTTQERAQLIEAKARQERSQRQVDRLKPLVARGAASASALEEQLRELEAARSSIKEIQSRIDERKIVAPFDGIVGLRNISVGTLAQPNLLIVTLDDDRTMKMDFSVPEVFLSSLKPGIQVVASARAFPDEVFIGTISSVDSRVNTRTRAVAARAVLDNKDGWLKAGMLMRVTLKKNPRRTLVVPEESLVKMADKSYVMLVNEQDGKHQVEKRQVEIGARRRGEVEVRAGLSEGMKVVTHGVLKVRDGVEVEIRGVDNGDQSLTDLLK